MKHTTTKLILAAAISLVSISSVFAQAAPNNPGRPPSTPQPVAETPNEDTEICFFTDFSFKESHFCVRGEQRTTQLDAIWADHLKSIKIAKEGSVKICNEPNLTGDCTIISASYRALPEEFINNVQSFRIR